MDKEKYFGRKDGEWKFIGEYSCSIFAWQHAENQCEEVLSETQIRNTVEQFQRLLNE
jgi:hypothetical protein